MFPFVRPLNLHPPASGAAPVTGACCIGATCVILTSAQCAASGGTYQGNNTTCTGQCIGGPG